MPLDSSPFAALTFIAAPAVLTNASSVLALGTSNRFARAIDRARDLAARIEKAKPDEARVPVWIRQFNRAHLRTLLLLRALRAFYFALGALAGASLVSLLGATLDSQHFTALTRLTLAVALTAGSTGVAALAFGCTQLVRETRLAVENIEEEAELIRSRFPDHEVR